VFGGDELEVESESRGDVLWREEVELETWMLC
jgi:hypothetical protein